MSRCRRLQSQDSAAITYGHIHVPSIALKEIPVQREQLRLKLTYGLSV